MGSIRTDRKQPTGYYVTLGVGGLHLILIKSNALSYILEALSMPQWLLKADVNPAPHRKGGGRYLARTQPTLTKALWFSIIFNS